MSSFIVRPETEKVIDPSERQISKDPIKIGDIFYESWGYDQTQNDFAIVTSISPSGKTVLCRMLGKKTVYQGQSIINPRVWEECRDRSLCTLHKVHHSNMVEPDNQPYGITFRLIADKGYQGEKSVKGSYPFVQWPDHPSENQRVHKRFGYFALYTKPVYETPSGMGH